MSPRKSRILLRIAFEGEDKGRVFGRSGRNIQAIRTVLQAIAQVAGHSIHLDIYGSQAGRRSDGVEEKLPPRSHPRRQAKPHSDP